MYVDVQANAPAARLQQHFAESFDVLDGWRPQRGAQRALHRRQIADGRFLDDRVGGDLLRREVARGPGPAGEHGEQNWLPPKAVPL